MAKNKKNKQINKFKSKYILVILVMFVIGIVYLLGYSIGSGKLRSEDKNVNTQSFYNDDSSKSNIFYTIEDIDANIKKFNSTTYALSFIFPASWSVQVGKAIKFEDGNYAGLIELTSPSGKSLSILPNAQTGWCEGVEDCTKELFITDSGINGYKYYSPSSPNNMSVYSFKNPKETNVTLLPLLVIKSNSNSIENDKIVRSINFSF